MKFSGSHLPGCLKLQWKTLVPCGQMERETNIFYIHYTAMSHRKPETQPKWMWPFFIRQTSEGFFSRSLLQKRPLIFHFRSKSRIILPFEEIFVSTCRFKSQQGKLGNENFHQQSPSPFKFFILKILNFKDRFSLNNAKKD